MPDTLFLLDLETDAAARRATLRLRDRDGIHLAAHEVALDAHAPSLWAGLFDTRRHVARMKDVEAPEAQLATLGQFLGDHVLGPGIVTELAEGVRQRTVLVRLPDPTKDDLAAAFARVPWELARAPGDGRDAARSERGGARGAGRRDAGAGGGRHGGGRGGRCGCCWCSRRRRGRGRSRRGWSGSGCWICSSGRCCRSGTWRWTCSATG